MCNVKFPVYSGNNKSYQVNKCCPLFVTQIWNDASKVRDTAVTEDGAVLRLRPSGVTKLQKVRGVAVVKVRSPISCCSLLCGRCCKCGCNCCSCDCPPPHVDLSSPIGDLYVIDRQHDASCPNCCAFFCPCAAFCEFYCCTKQGCCIPTLTPEDFFETEYFPEQNQGPPQQSMDTGK